MVNDNLFRKYNILIGWVVFIFSATIYCITIEPTASFWDCGEYIACAHGLEAGHPPGAPFFLLLAKFFSLFSFGNPKHIAALINTMSALASAFTVLFLFWSITHLAKKIILKTQESYSTLNLIITLTAGVIGALSYSFTDSAWFSAGEGEVYALSSLFTAIVFWAMLRWESAADEPHSDRWLIFIAYMIGLSIGVHLLNLLTIPAMVFVWYFRKKETTILGVVITSIVALAMLGGVQDVLIPGIVSLAGKTELFFVNYLGFGFNSGIIFYFTTIIIVITTGLLITIHKKIIWLNTAILCFTVLLIGYSSFFILVIRAQAGTPINENKPSDAVSLLSYLNREQYGDWPLLYGQSYNSPLDNSVPYLDGNPIYVQDVAKKKYIVSDARKQSISNYDTRGCSFFPRMYSASHTQAYESWVTGKGDSTVFTDENGKITSTALIPTTAQNLQFFLAYQCGWMYARYFMWNFWGRQNDFLGYGNDVEGNWLSGIPKLDNARLGDQDLLPQSQRDNKARNCYFGIPFFLGILGLIWHFKNSKKDATVATLLFVFTGLAIVLYLNQTPWQPRDRDYAYVGSFYAFSIWIGLGVVHLFEIFGGAKKAIIAVTFAMICSILSPMLLLAQNWNDHNRSGRTVGNDIAINFLNSCEKNAILFTYADNDTFPLWYAQEVLGIRQDVRIVCISLFRCDWYIDQMKKKQYTSEPLPISMKSWDYREGTRDYINLFEETNDTLELSKVVDLFTTNKFSDRFVSTSGDTLNYIPTRNMKIPVNKKEFLKSNTLNVSNVNDIEDSIYFRIRGSYLLKDQIAILDMLAHNEWKRPIYFAVNMPGNSYVGLDDYLQLEGLAYRLVPMKNMRAEKSLTNRPQVQLEKSYKLVMNTFSFGGLKNPNVYADITSQRMFADPIRFSCSVIANALAEAGKKKEAIAVIKKCTSEIPATQIAPDNTWLEMINTSYLADDYQLAGNLSRICFMNYFNTFRWYQSFGQRTPGDIGSIRDGMFALVEMATIYNAEVLKNDLISQLKILGLSMPIVEPEIFQ